MAIILWDKKYTETLAETLKRFRLEKSEYENEKVTYAGRLDPMAEGLLILLTGDDVHKKEEFLGLNKIYEVDFIFGFETDTYDILGLTTKICSVGTLNENKLKKELSNIIGKSEQKYPPYSSKPVQGKALFEWARESRLNEIEIPTREIEIFNTHYISVKKILIQDFKKNITDDIQSVVGDFRQNEIVESWNDFFKNSDIEFINKYSVRISVSSGAYIRSIIHEVGKVIGGGACTIKIKRLQIGNYKL